MTLEGKDGAKRLAFISRLKNRAKLPTNIESDRFSQFGIIRETFRSSISNNLDFFFSLRPLWALNGTTWQANARGGRRFAFQINLPMDFHEILNSYERKCFAT